MISTLLVVVYTIVASLKIKSVWMRDLVDLRLSYKSRLKDTAESGSRTKTRTRVKLLITQFLNNFVILLIYYFLFRNEDSSRLRRRLALISAITRVQLGFSYDSR